MNPQDKVLLGVIGARDAEILESQLSAQGIAVATIYNHSSCTSGCSPSKEIWAHAEDVPAIQKHMIKERLAMLEDMGVSLEQINQVYDSNELQATCPACGEIFKTTHTECPECGLRFV